MLNTPGVPRTRIRIKAPPKRQHAPESEDSWQTLATAITQIHQKNASVLSYEELYRIAYNMVMRKKGSQLYNGVREVVELHLKDVAENEIKPAFGILSTSSSSASRTSNDMPGASSSMSDGNSSFLKVMKKVWEDHTMSMRMIKDVLSYGDKWFVEYARVPPTYEMGLALFRDTIARSPQHPIQAHIQKVMLEQIARERKGESIDRSTLKAVTNMLLSLPDDKSNDSVYVVDFEKAFLQTSSEFYKIESQMLISQCDAPQYMKKVEKRLNEEQERTQHYLSKDTEERIRKIVEEELIANHIRALIEMEGSGLTSMISENRIEDINRMYKLFSRVPSGLKEMREAIASQIKDMGHEINRSVDPSTLRSKEDKEDEKGSTLNNSSAIAMKWVEDLLQLKEKFDNVLEKALAKDKSFQTGFNEAFELFINSNPRSPEFISLFIDENLKKGLKGKTEAEVDAVLDKTITLFRFIKDKDVFERYYKQHLAKRLLWGRSVSDDAERGMITKLKVECGYQFTTKLEGMFNDMRISADTMVAFKEYLDVSQVQRPQVEMSVNVLSAAFWPMNVSSSPPCNFPEILTQSCQTFEKFYFGRHSGRRLTWQPNMGTADVRAQFKAKRHELNVSTYGMVVLLLFNDLAEGECLTMTDIESHTGIQMADLKRTLQSLACAKYKILVKEPKSRDVNPDDKFYFNADFTCPLARIKIQQIASRVETDSERRVTQDKVDEERKHQTEAAIVRIMKDRKRMDHNNLIAEVTKQLTPRFVPSPAMIKKRLEALIDREYLSRDEQDRKTYEYQA
ncbi:hypothetical protein BZG36_01568 [Bifiguratus adelaidae]|uniref:Cullin family profile domain-containing protein n=1 Tax=Bifiguratus adelaidae TaxID=1938954 RepID=A0A261Y3X5_9FUNG|nr:hypothetical protein BZG36_01568 [Bifiguratus adelaidae]